MGKVLVVDDDMNTGLLVKINIEQLGHQVISKTNGADAIAYMETERPDMVIVDLIMPGGITGIDVIQWLRKRWDTPVMVVTAHGDKLDLRDLALEIGATDYIMKPFRRDEFLERVKKMMNGDSSHVSA